MPQRRMSSAAIGSLIAAAVMLPLTAWARHEGVALEALAVLTALLVVWCCGWRIVTGHWPGDNLQS